MIKSDDLFACTSPLESEVKYQTGPARFNCSEEGHKEDHDLELVWLLATIQVYVRTKTEL